MSNMTSSYKAVFIASALITLSLFFIIMNSGSQNQAPTFLWSMTVWYMYKNDYQASVTLQKYMMVIAGLVMILPALGSFQEDKTISNLLGFSYNEMFSAGFFSFCVHFWLLRFFQKCVSVSLRKKKVSASYIDPVDNNITSESGDKVRDSQEIGFDIWEMASEEYDNNRNTGIWAMAFAESEGNEGKAKALYLKTRAEQLANDFDQKTLEEDTSSFESDTQYIEDPPEEVEEGTSSSEAGRVKISAILERYQYIEDPSETENVKQNIEDPSETENVEQTIPVTQDYDALMKSENRKNLGENLYLTVVIFLIVFTFAIVLILG